MLTAPNQENISTEICDTTTYSTHIEITDDYNVIQPNVPVALWASSPCSVYINDATNTDAYFTMDTATPLLLKTDITGNVTIMQPVDTIGGISYYIAVQDATSKQNYTEAINPLSNTVARLNSKVPDGSKDYLTGVQVTAEDGTETDLVSSSYSSQTANTSNHINTICQQNAHLDQDGLVTGQLWPTAAAVAAAFSTVQSMAQAATKPSAQPAFQPAITPAAKKTGRIIHTAPTAAGKNRVKKFAKRERLARDIRFDPKTDKIWGWTFGKNAAHYEGIEAIKEMGLVVQADGSLAIGKRHPAGRI